MATLGTCARGQLLSIGSVAGVAERQPSACVPRPALASALSPASQVAPGPLACVVVRLLRILNSAGHPVSPLGLCIWSARAEASGSQASSPRCCCCHCPSPGRGAGCFEPGERESAASGCRAVLLEGVPAGLGLWVALPRASPGEPASSSPLLLRVAPLFCGSSQDSLFHQLQGA